MSYGLIYHKNMWNCLFQYASREGLFVCDYTAETSADKMLKL